jgi:hypothetical protein
MRQMDENEILNWLRKNKPNIYYLYISSKSLINNSNVRDLSKLYAEANEFIQRDWINSNTNVTVVKREDYEHSGNAAGFDLISIDGKLKIQSKLRYNGLHIEQTRRNSVKNNKATNSNTGYTRYAIGEADVYLFSKPPTIESYNDINSWNFIAIPESELIDKNYPGYLLSSVPKKIWTRFLGKTKDVIENEYNIK